MQMRRKFVLTIQPRLDKHRLAICNQRNKPIGLSTVAMVVELAERLLYAG